MMAPGRTNSKHTNGTQRHTRTPTRSPLSADEGSKSVGAKEGGEKKEKEIKCGEETDDTVHDGPPSDWLSSGATVYHATAKAGYRLVAWWQRKRRKMRRGRRTRRRRSWRHWSERLAGKQKRAK